MDSEAPSWHGTGFGLGSRLEMRPTSLTVLLVVALCSCGLWACAPPSETTSEDRFAPPVLGAADGPESVDVLGRLAPDAPVSGELPSSSTRLGWLFRLSADSAATVEVTQAGSSRGLDTLLSIWGPRAPDGIFRDLAASDDASGYGELSAVRGFAPAREGWFLAMVEVDPATAEGYTPKSFRLSLACTAGTCAGDDPATVPGNDVRWTQVSAEMKALSIQSYAVAASRLEEQAARGELPPRWAVALDVDETVLSNLTYQRERAELGLGYSPMSWAAWVARREATPMPGAARFLARVRELGGTIALVTNRSEAECPATRENLDARGLPYDVILCRIGPSAKAARWAMVESGAAGVPAATLVMWVGDNIQDFPRLSQDVRYEDDAAFGDFGQRFVLIPNPMYGSWERNID